MNLIVERTPILQKDKPAGVLVKLLDDKGEIQGSVWVYPKWADPKAPPIFQVEVNKGGGISPSIDIRVQI